MTLREAARRLRVSYQTMRNLRERWAIRPVGTVKVRGYRTSVYPWPVIERAFRERPPKMENARVVDPPTRETLAALWQVLDHIAPVKIGG